MGFVIYCTGDCGGVRRLDGDVLRLLADGALGEGAGQQDARAGGDE